MQEVFEKIIEKIKNMTHDNPMTTDSYILREEAIKAIEEEVAEYEHNREYRYMSLLADAVIKHGSNIVEKYEKGVSEIKTENTNGWIPCSERLPERDGFYLATFGVVEADDESEEK